MTRTGATVDAVGAPPRTGGESPRSALAGEADASSHRRSMRYLPGIDGLRAVSVIAVLLYHARVASVPGGFLGVEIFFVVSGYLITALLLDERRTKGKISLTAFWSRRARRLLPALYVMLAVTVAYSLLFLPDAIERLRSDAVAALAYVSNWWQIFGDQSYFAEAGRPPLLRHLWSLAVEEQFYLLWPLVLGFVIARWPRGKVMVGILAAALGSAVWMALLHTPYEDPTRVYYGTDTRLSGLLLGALLAFVWTPYKLRGRPGRGAGFVVDLAGLAGLAVVAWSILRVNDFDPFVYRGGFLLLGAATVLVIAAAVHPKAKLGRVLGVAPLVWLGVRSYGIYLWHWPVYAVTRPGVDIDLHGRPLLMLRLALTVVLADISYRYVEQPIRHGAIGTFFERIRTERGQPRRALLGRGALVGLSALVGAALLGFGLVNAAGQPVNASGRTAELAAATSDDDPSAPIAAATSSTISPTAPTAVDTAPPTTASKAARKAAGSDSESATAPTAPAKTDGDAEARQDQSAANSAGQAEGGDQRKNKKDAKSGTEDSAAGAAAAESTDATASSPTTAAEQPVAVAAAPDGNRVIAIGDSVMLGASGELQAAMPGVLVDAKVSRSFVNALDVAAWYRDNGLLRDVVVVHQGTNGAFSDAQFDQMMEIIGPARTAVFMNANVPRSWETAVNDRLASGTARWANAFLADWKGLSSGHTEWFAADGFHVEHSGGVAYSQLVSSTILVAG